MERIPVSENFFLDEFLDKTSYTNLLKIIGIAQFIRSESELPVTINNWSSGGQYQFSGFRPADCTIGSPTSEHKKLLCAADIKIHGLNGKEMHNWAVKHAPKLYELGVRRIEDPSLTVSWLHVDLKEHGRKGIKIIDLKKETGFIEV